MKKLVSFILAGLMVGLMISGCQGEDMDQETHELLETMNLHLLSHKLLIKSG